MPYTFLGMLGTKEKYILLSSVFLNILIFICFKDIFFKILFWKPGNSIHTNRALSRRLKPATGEDYNALHKSPRRQFMRLPSLKNVVADLPLRQIDFRLLLEVI